MREVQGNLWELPADARCITTNGYVTKTGKAVMGRGCALEAKEKIKGIDSILGLMLTSCGNHVHHLVCVDPVDYFSFPVKHHWREKADLELIARSARELTEKVEEWNFGSVLLPRPGCGNGQLEWDDVKAVIEPILDDRIAVVTFA